MPGGTVIIGGGFSGLAAAVDLCDDRRDVLVLERRPHLGGRAYSFIDSVTGDVVDNGQHLFMACYTSTVAFLKKIGCDNRLKFQRRASVDFVAPGNDISRFECAPLPAPFHAMAGIMGLGGLSLRERLSALKVGAAIRGNGGGQPETVAEWLEGLGQSHRIRERFWYPMATATLNEDPAIASSRMLRVVLKLGLANRAADSRLGIARVGLSDLYTGGARSFIETHGSRVMTRSPVRRLIIEGRRVRAVDLATGERIEADWFISAVPHNALLHLIPPEYRKNEFGNLALLRNSPIISINLWFDRPITDVEFAGLIGTDIQWLFNKSAIMSTGHKYNQVALVISAARRFIDWPTRQLAEMAATQVLELFPRSRKATLIRSRVIKERDATLAHTLESDSLRPNAVTSLENLLLAGDWTNTGLPATIESAVRSGQTAARLVNEMENTAP